MIWLQVKHALRVAAVNGREAGEELGGVFVEGRATFVARVVVEGHRVVCLQGLELLHAEVALRRLLLARELLRLESIAEYVLWIARGTIGLAGFHVTDFLHVR